MSEATFDSFFDKVDGAKNGKTNDTLEMKELREALYSSCLNKDERKLAGMLLDEYDFAKSLRDGGGQISRGELSDYIALNKGRFENKQTAMTPGGNDAENRRAYLSNFMERINFNFSRDNDDNRYLSKDELRTALQSGHDKHGAALSRNELELVETLYLNWKRDIKNVSEKKGEDNDGISVYDLYALAERRPAKFGDISDKVNQAYQPEETTEAPPQVTEESAPESDVPPPAPVPMPPELPRIPVPTHAITELPEREISQYRVPVVELPRCRPEERIWESHREIVVIIRGGNIRISGPVSPYFRHDHHGRHYDHHHRHDHRYKHYDHYDRHHDRHDRHHDHHHHHDRQQDRHRPQIRLPQMPVPRFDNLRSFQVPRLDNYSFHNGPVQRPPAVIDRYDFHGGRRK